MDLFFVCQSHDEEIENVRNSCHSIRDSVQELEKVCFFIRSFSNSSHFLDL